MMMTDHCALCGASLPAGSDCATIFGECLNLEHDPAYGAVQFLTVASYMIQHGRYSDEALRWIESALRQYLERQLSNHDIRQIAKRDIGGVARSWKITRPAAAPPLPPHAWSMTIADVATCLNDPARYRERVTLAPPDARFCPQCRAALGE